MALSPALSELLGETSVSLPGSYYLIICVLNKIHPALTAPMRQEDLGIRQRARSARSKRQASNPLRRRHARRIQARPRPHVHHEQDPQPESLRHGRRIIAVVQLSLATTIVNHYTYPTTLYASYRTPRHLDIYGLLNYTNEAWASRPFPPSFLLRVSCSA